MNYKHAYHAGNFADVAKHVLLLQLLDLFCQKNKPFYALDAYGGRGLYALNSAESKKTQEAKNGVFALIDFHKNRPDIPCPPAIERYLDGLERAKKIYDKHVYPGSPWWIADCAASFASLRAEAFEYSADEYDALRYQLHRLPIGVHHRDAFEGALGVIPPKEKRGFVLFDPPFEQEHKDFGRLVDLLLACHKKWATGAFALWYPLKNRDATELFYKKMKRSGLKKQLVCQLRIYPDDLGIGLNGTGFFVINPPWQFAERAEEILRYLALALKVGDAPALPLSDAAKTHWLIYE